MKSVNTMTLLTLVFSFVGCGTDSSESASKTTSETKPSSTPKAESAKESAIMFKGFLGGPFPIVVDGVGYEDSEDFYTKELSRLPEKISAAGYDSSWSWKFEAVLGFSDLRTNMMVYIAPQEQKGYQGEGPVSYAGGFEIALPREALDSSFKVRAVKRVNVVLERNSEVVKICYNFSAIDKGVRFEETSKPIILDQFSTRLTAYACGPDASNGLVIPPAKSNPAQTSPSPSASPVPASLKPGASQYDGAL